MTPVRNLHPPGAGVLIDLAAPALAPTSHESAAAQAPEPALAQMARAFADAGFRWALSPQVVSAVAIEEEYALEPGCFLADVPRRGQFMERLPALDAIVNTLRVRPLPGASHALPTCLSCSCMQVKRSDKYRL